MSHVSFQTHKLVSEENAGPRMGQTVVQWLTARKSRSADLGKTSHGPWVTKEKHGFWVVDIFWIVLFTPLFLWMMSPLSKRNCQNPHSPTDIFMEFWPWGACQGRLKRCGWNCQGLRNFFHHQLPQLRLLGCWKSRFLKQNFNAMGVMGSHAEVEILLIQTCFLHE